MDDEELKFEDYLRLEKEFRNDTVKHYLYYYRVFKPFKLNKEDVRYFLLKKCPNYVARAFLRTYIRFVKNNITEYPHLKEDDLLEEKLFPEKPKSKARKIPEVITKDEVERLINETTTQRNKVMLILSFYGGLRLRELMGISVHDFFWSEWEKDQGSSGKLKITSLNAKNGKERFVSLPGEMMKLIYIYLVDNNRNDQLFDIVGRTWQKHLEKESIRILGKKVNPHMLRHSFATHCVENDIPIEQVKSMLGHSDISTTQIYLHFSQQKIKESYERVFN